MSKTDTPIARPQLGEVASATKLDNLESSYLVGMTMQNPDQILSTRGDQELTIYKELLRDDQVASCYQQRRLALTSKEIMVEPASESAEDKAAAEFIHQQIKALNFDLITERMHYAVHYGYSVGEFIWDIQDNKVTVAAIKVRPRYRFRFNRKHQLFYTTQTQPQGKKAPQRKFWVLNYGAEDDHNPYGLGLAHALYWPVFFKRNDIKFWLIFLEKFGMPTAQAKLPAGQANDPKERDKALEVLDAIQSDSGVVVPDNVVVELIEAARSGTADYRELCDRMDKAISKIILSQTMTTDNGSSLAQAKVHSGVRDEVVKADADLLCESLNQTLVRWLTEWNFPNANPPRIFRNCEQEEDLNQRADRDTKISNMGFEPTEEYITETYGPGWVKKQAPEVKPPVPGQPIPAEFTEISGLLQQRADRRADQQAIVDAAQELSSKYADFYGDRIEQLKSYLEQSDGDFHTFKEHLASMMADAPEIETVKTIRNATIVSRLAGMFRKQRD